MTRARVVTVGLLTAILSMLGVAGAAWAAADGTSSPGEVRRVTASYHDAEAAQRSGYGLLPSGTPLHSCIDEDLDLDDVDGKPAMGLHLVNGALLDSQIDATHPEVLVYEPTRNGRLRLVAVEYVVFESAWAATGAVAPPRLLGREFDHVQAPNRYGLPAFYALHAWVWKHNPDGMFASMNPRVSCVHATP